MERVGQRERYAKGGIGRWYWDHRDRAVMPWIGDGPILDVGCGEGITTEKAGAIGMDLDQGDVRGSVYDLPFKSGTFGTVLFLEVIEHLKDWARAIGEIKRILKPGGKIVMVFPNDWTFKVAWSLFFMWREIFRNRGHLGQWTPREARNVVRWSGFRIIESRSIPFHFWTLSLHHLIVARKT
jgi:SAM-dependent methyltransferase